MYGFFEAGCVFKPMHAVCSRVFSQGCNTNQTGTQIIKFYAYTYSSLIERVYTALCNKSNGRCDIKAEKREELESKSSHKSDIWLPAASKK